ncbi:hypothetical protein X729_31105 [Mesorhizobium sp. L103C131B0]|nr:hypothetical protein X729_31105 [Mesorhizobium sp. L103C131B0]
MNNLGVSSVEEESYSDELNGGEEITRGLVIAGGDGAEVLEPVEEPLDEIALAVEREIGLARRDAVGLGWDDRRDSSVLKGSDEGIGVVGLVRKKGLRVDLVEQRLSLAKMGGLARGQREADGVAPRRRPWRGSWWSVRLGSV